MSVKTVSQWQNKSERGLDIFLTEKWSDCTFLVGTAPNQRLIAGHKQIISLASPVFEAMFFGALPNKSYPIPLEDTEPDAFQAMMEYIYSDRIDITSVNIAGDLYYLGKKYMIPGIVNGCTIYLTKNLCEKNACRILEMAKLFEVEELLCKTMKLIIERMNYILSEVYYTDIEISTLILIFNQGRLNISSELDLFEALENYVECHGGFNENDCVSKGNGLPYMEKSDSADAVADVAENSCVIELNDKTSSEKNSIDEDLIRQALKKIRFLTLTPAQFAAGSSISKLLKDKEKLAIFTKICNPKDVSYSMPEGFCISGISRIKNNTGAQADNKWCFCGCPNY